MIEITYVNSQNKTLNLLGDKLRICNGSFHTYSWEKETKEAEMGDKVEKFRKGDTTYSITIALRGKLEKRKEMLNELHEAFEYDVACKTPGKIYFGTYYIECFVTQSETIVNSAYITENKLEIYCPYPQWIGEAQYTFHGFGISASDCKTYPYKYTTRYANGMNNAYILNEHFYDSNFTLIIYGPVVNPQVAIGGSIKLVYIVLEEGEYLKIDSRAGTVTKVMMDGTRVNAYHNRKKGSEFFRKIPPGRQSIVWTGKFDFDLTLFEERSEPKW